MNKEIRRKEISDFAKKLRELVETAPDGYARRDINRMIVGLRHRYALTPEQKQSLILKLLAEGLTTYSELLNETRFGNTQLTRQISQLITDKKIRSEKLRPATGRGGPPMLCYFVV